MTSENIKNKNAKKSKSKENNKNGENLRINESQLKSEPNFVGGTNTQTKP